jgi:ferredoxin
MKRNIIQIDEEKCNGCGLCVSACHEGALQMIDGKARLITDSYCDGLGDCLPECPTGAITIEEREADPYDEVAVKARMAERQAGHGSTGTAASGEPAASGAHPFPAYAGGGCPSSRPISLDRPASGGCPGSAARTLDRQPAAVAAPARQESELRQWPVQIKLVPVKAPYLHNANILVAADCTAFAYANIHQDFMRNRVTLIGCPKLDEGDYAEKFTAILQHNEIKSLTVLRMDVPCCGGITHAVKRALMASGKMIPWQVVTVGTNGEILPD